MRKQFAYIGILILGLSLVGCDKQVTNSKTVSYPNVAYTSVVCNCPIRISFCKKATEMIVTAEEHMLNDVRLDCDEKGILTISIDHLNKQYWEERPWVILPIPEQLSRLTVYSMASIDADTTLTADKMEWEFSGAVTIDSCELAVRELSITSYSYGTDMHISGSADKVVMELHSAGYNAFALETKKYDCTLWNSDANVTCSNLLLVRNANNSTLNYRGDCTVECENALYSSSINRIE